MTVQNHLQLLCRRRVSPNRCRVKPQTARFIFKLSPKPVQKRSLYLRKPQLVSLKHLPKSQYLKLLQTQPKELHLKRQTFRSDLSLHAVERVPRCYLRTSLASQNAQNPAHSAPVILDFSLDHQHKWTSQGKHEIRSLSLTIAEPIRQAEFMPLPMTGREAIP
jgi:hypothetical protein